MCNYYNGAFQSIQKRKLMVRVGKLEPKTPPMSPQFQLGKIYCVTNIVLHSYPNATDEWNP
jgi:hypothetical protein